MSENLTSPTPRGVTSRFLASGNHRIWPNDKWLPMRFDRTLQIGARGGHNGATNNPLKQDSPALVENEG